MNKQEIIQITLGILVLTGITIASQLFQGDFTTLVSSLIGAIVIVLIYVGARKLAARALDAEVEHELWAWQRYGFKPHQYAPRPIALGAVMPLVLSILSMGWFKVPTLFTYETEPLKRRASKRFGFYSFTEMTDWHIALIGASGIVALLVLSTISYLIPGAETLWQVAAYMAFWNMLPISKLDGAQIYFGSRVLWTGLSLVAAVFAIYALII
jgi:Zn-dependent protease